MKGKNIASTKASGIKIITDWSSNNMRWYSISLELNPKPDSNPRTGDVSKRQREFDKKRFCG